ncbi:MAG: hypothetical protein H6682_21545, partial [Candidatus Eisenbacteria bacterium]|nr:hypothetical protein [Candidatus Eisenbacteria bacterium]
MSGPAAFDRHTVRVSSSILCAFFFVAIATAVRTVTAAQAGAASTEVAPSVLASGAPTEAVPAAQAGFCPFVVRASAQDIATGRPIPLVGYRLFRLDHSKERETPSATAQSDDEGTALFRDICPGSYEIEASHVGYESSRRALRIPASAGGAAPDTIRVELRLQAKVFQVEEVDVHAETVAPAADLERGSLAVPRAATELFVGHDLVDAVAVVPGVLVTGERIYFRGLEQTHVTATIDGIPAVDPISGRWILPPPQSLTGAEVVASAMVSEAVPAIGGLLSMRLASGEGPFRAKVVYGSDRVGSFPSGSRDTDTVILSAAGSTPVPGLVASAAYRGTASNGALSYDRGLVSQDLLGISGWGRRMNGEESVSAKLSWSGARVWRLDAAVVSTDQTRKAYHHHYSRSGWVSYVPQLDEYSEFIEGEPHPDDIFYEGPLHVPVETTESTLLYLRGSFAPSSTLDFDLRTFHSSHTSETALPNARFRDAGSLIDWWRDSITRANHQAGWFYAVQGDLPTFRWSRSRETGASLTGSYAPSDQHRLRFGLSATLGRHRLVNAVSAPIYYYGSFDEHLDSRDVTSYVEETWKSDAHSWLRVSLRQLTRKLELPGGTVERTRIAPAIAFHQPMSATDALNVEVGQTYQFPVLENSFLASTADERIPSLQVERARYVELGVQR